MIEVELPDGSIAEFPDGTSPEVIKGALRKRFGAPAQPEGRGIGRRVDDFVRGVADTASFGFSDELAAVGNTATGQGTYSDNVAAERARDSEGGWERVGGQVAGAFLNPAGAARSVGGAILQGAGMGALYGLGSGEGTITERAPSAGVGALVGGAAGGAVRTIANKLGTKAAAKAIPSNEQLRKAADAAYGKAEAAGVIFKQDSLKRLATDIVTDLTDKAFDDTMQPGIAAFIRKFQSMAGQNITLKGLDTLRKMAGNAAKDVSNPTQQMMASKIIDRIDDFIDGATDADAIMGNAKVGAQALKEARDLWGRLRKSQMVDTAALKAERRAASTGKGGNADNALRQNVRGLLDNPKTARGMTAAEKAQAERVVRGTPGQNALRWAGGFAPSASVSSGISTALGAGGGALVGGGPLGAMIGSVALPMAGQIAKSTADRMTVRNAERLSQIIRSGGRTAKDLAALSRGGKLPNDQIARLEKVAKTIGIPLSELAAVLAERVVQPQ